MIEKCCYKKLKLCGKLKFVIKHKLRKYVKNILKV